MFVDKTEYVLESLLPGRKYSINVQAVSNGMESNGTSIYQVTSEKKIYFLISRLNVAMRTQQRPWLIYNEVINAFLKYASSGKKSTERFKMQFISQIISLIK